MIVWLDFNFDWIFFAHFHWILMSFQRWHFQFESSSIVLGIETKVSLTCRKIRDKLALCELWPFLLEKLPQRINFFYRLFDEVVFEFCWSIEKKMDSTQTWNLFIPNEKSRAICESFNSITTCDVEMFSRRKYCLSFRLSRFLLISMLSTVSIYARPSFTASSIGSFDDQ